MKQAIILLLICLSSAVFTSGKTSKGFLVGTVADPTGAVVPTANITITNTATGAVRTTTSQENGSYRLDAIDPGTYNLEVSATGFTNARSEILSSLRLKPPKLIYSFQLAALRRRLMSSVATATFNCKQPTARALPRLNKDKLPSFRLPG